MSPTEIPAKTIVIVVAAVGLALLLLVFLGAE